MNHEQRSVSPDDLRRAREGDAAAWERINDFVRHFVESKPVPPRIDPEEVFTDTLTRLWKSLPNLRDDTKFREYVGTVVRRVISKHRVDATRYRPLITDPAVSDRDVGAQNLEGEELLRSLTGALKAADQRLFKLLYVVGASPPQVQEELGVTGRLLRQRKHRMHARLRQAAHGSREHAGAADGGLAAFRRSSSSLLAAPGPASEAWFHLF